MPRRRRVSYRVAGAPANVLSADVSVRVPDPECKCQGCRDLQGVVQSLLLGAGCRQSSDVKVRAVWAARNAFRVLPNGRIGMLVKASPTDHPFTDEGDEGEGYAPRTTGQAFLRVSDEHRLYMLQSDAALYLDSFMAEHLVSSYDADATNKFVPPLQTYQAITNALRDDAGSSPLQAMAGCLTAIARSAGLLSSSRTDGAFGREKDLRMALSQVYYGVEVGLLPCLAQKEKKEKGKRTIHGAKRSPIVGVLPMTVLRESGGVGEPIATAPTFYSCGGTGSCINQHTFVRDARCSYHCAIASNAWSMWHRYYGSLGHGRDGLVTMLSTPEAWSSPALTLTEAVSYWPAPPNDGNPVKQYPALRTDDMVRMVGVEVEYNGVTPAKTKAWASRWGAEIHSDSSCAGYEACTPPAAGVSFGKCIHELCETLRPVTADQRCGLHVHVDGRDLSWADIIRLCSVWERVEAAMYVLGGQTRAGSEFAKPMAKELKTALMATDVKAAIIGVIRGMSPGTDAIGDKMGRYHTPKNAAERWRMSMRYTPPNKKASGRYRAMNLTPWLSGRRDAKNDLTVEFRLHCNTKQPNRIVQWASLLSCMVQWVATHNDADVAALPKSAMRALCVMSPSHAGWIAKRIKEWRANTQVTMTREGESGATIARRRYAPVKGVWQCVA